MGRPDAKQRFDAEVWPHAPTILRVSQYLVGGRGDAEDLAQETLLKAFRFIGQLRPGSDARRWLLTILRNTAADRNRAVGRHPQPVALPEAGDVPASPEPGPSVPAGRGPEQLLEAFSDQQVIDALRALPEEIRWTLLLLDVEGIDQAEAAAVLEVPIGTVKSRAHRGRAMLRPLLMPARNRALQR